MARKRKRRVSGRRKTTSPTPEQIVQAINHPTRVAALRILLNRTANPKAIADELDMPLPNISYHIRTLEDLGLVEVTEEESVRGSVAHFFSPVSPEKIRAALAQFFDLST